MLELSICLIWYMEKKNSFSNSLFKNNSKNEKGDKEKFLPQCERQRMVMSTLPVVPHEQFAWKIERCDGRNPYNTTKEIA